MKKVFILLIFLGFYERMWSQDFHLSMYDAAPLFLNSSMTGVFDGEWRVHAQYRNQWRAVNFKPYTTALVSFDMPYKKWGFGAQVTNLRAGFGNYNALQGLLSAAYSVPFDAAKDHNISFGIQLGATQKSVEYQLLTYDNQYTTSNGGGFDNSLNSGESFAGQSFFSPNANAGIMYYYSRQQSKINPFIGLSAFNLIPTKETLLDADNELPRRYYLHSGVRINVTELVYILPKVLIMNQGDFNEQTLAVDAGFYLKPTDLYLLGGLIFRNKDAMILSLGVKKSSYVAKIAYDFNVSSLAPSSTGRGGFEISFTYTKGRKKPGKAKICPRI